MGMSRNRGSEAGSKAGRRRRSGRTRHATLATLIERLESRAMLSGNEPPENAVPGPQEVRADQPFAFTAYRGNQISVSDPDAETNTVQVTLSVDKGRLTLLDPNPSGGLTYSAGDGTEDGSMTFTGTIGDINSALSWISYRPEAERFFQWKEADGGNDHWYEHVSAGATWTAANTAATARGGYLATVTSAAENTFVNGFLPPTVEAWVGGYQDRSGLTFSEPLGGWRWVTSEPWSYTRWSSSQPDDAGGTEHYLTTNLGSSLRWNDRPESFSTHYVIEYESDPRPADYLQATLTITTNDLGTLVLVGRSQPRTRYRSR